MVHRKQWYDDGSAACPQPILSWKELLGNVTRTQLVIRWCLKSA